MDAMRFLCGAIIFLLLCEKNYVTEPYSIYGIFPTMKLNLACTQAHISNRLL